MKREIKFRAWDSGENKIMPIKIIDWKDDLCTVDEGDNTITDHIEMFELMQFTGLKDKNGVDIYEGDIIKTGRNDDWGVIVYKAPFFEVTVSEEQSCMYTREWFANVEIIGNIYENPDLLTN